MNKKVVVSFAIAWAAITLPAIIILVNQQKRPEPIVVGSTPEEELAKKKKRFEQEINKSPHTPENLLKLVNAERAKIGIKPLRLDERLNQSARMKVDDMVKYKYLAHENHDGSQGTDFIIKLINSTECPYVGENVGQDKYGLNQDILDKYFTSTPHKNAILNPEAKAIGFNTQQDGEDTYNAMHFCEE